MPRVAISHSALDLLARCGVAYEYRYVRGLKRPPGFALHVGRAVDASATANYRHRIEHAEPLPAEAVVDLARDTLEREIESAGVALTEEEARAGFAAVKGLAVDQATGGAFVHHAAVAPRRDPAHVQRRVELDLTGEDVGITCVVDLQERDGRVVDTKTSRRRPPADAADLSDQLSIYDLAIAVAENAPEDLVRPVALDYVVFRKGGAEPLPPLVSVRGAADRAQVALRMERALAVIRAGAFYPARPTDWWCSQEQCGYWTLCPFARRQVSVAVSS